jgi:diadenosine tetraphosphatase ApaH/serine/threonine PP2A family protein phosphatase
LFSFSLAASDLLWADPIGDEMVVGRSADDPWLKEWLDVRFDFNEERGCSKYFGYKAIVEFAERNNIDSIIRYDLSRVF